MFSPVIQLIHCFSLYVILELIQNILNQTSNREAVARRKFSTVSAWPSEAVLSLLQLTTGMPGIFPTDVQEN